MNEQLNTTTEFHKQQIALQLSDINKKVDGMYQGKMNWGHAGDLAHILKALKEINQFIGKQ